MSKKAVGNRQYAALPYRHGAGGGIEVLLITSLNSRRWIIPKGWPAANLTPSESAAREAVEEAGVVGRIGRRPIGTYTYEKRTGRGVTIRCTVETFALEVEAQLSEWPEQDRRSTRWFPLQDAAKAVQEPELQILIANLPVILKL